MFDFFKDIFNSFRQSSLERIKSPFLGAFVFSWVGFNWQMLAVLLLSKDDVLIRLNYINANFGIEKLLLGPISTTILICIMLPTANKIITKLQKNTNHETNVLILQSKIDIATKQLEIAEFEAKKKLAEEREKKNIDADVNAIITSRDQLSDNLKDARNAIDAHQKTIESLLSREVSFQDTIGKLESSLKLTSEDNNKFNLELVSQKKILDERNRELLHVRTEINKLTEESMKTSVLFNSVSDEKFKLQGEVRSLKEQNEKLKSEVKDFTMDIANLKSKLNDRNATAHGNQIKSQQNLTPSYSSSVMAAAKAAAGMDASSALPDAIWGQSATSAALAAAATAVKSPSELWGQSASAALAAAVKSPSELWGQSASAALAAAVKSPSELWGQSASAALAAAVKSPSELWGQSASAALASAAKSSIPHWDNLDLASRLANNHGLYPGASKASELIEKVVGESSGIYETKSLPKTIESAEYIDPNRSETISDGNDDIVNHDKDNIEK